MTEATTYPREQLIDALQNEWEFLIHDDFIEGEDMTAEEHLKYLQSLSDSQLLDEIALNDNLSLQEFMSYYGRIK